MKVKDMISELLKFDSELDITISDGFDFHFYDTRKENPLFVEIEEVNGNKILDIGIGGLIED
jgi:hypothetical protein